MATCQLPPHSGDVTGEMEATTGGMGTTIASGEHNDDVTASGEHNDDVTASGEHNDGHACMRHWLSWWACGSLACGSRHSQFAASASPWWAATIVAVCPPLQIAGTVAALAVVAPVACWVQQVSDYNIMPNTTRGAALATTVFVFLLLNSVNSDRITHTSAQIRQQAMVLVAVSYASFFTCVCLVVWQPDAPESQSCRTYEMVGVAGIIMAATLVRFADAAMRFTTDTRISWLPITDAGNLLPGSSALQPVICSIVAAFLLIVGVATYACVQASGPVGAHYGFIAASQHAVLAPLSACVFLGHLPQRGQEQTPCATWSAFMPTFVYACGVFWPGALWVAGWLPAWPAAQSATAAVCVVTAFRLGATTLNALESGHPPRPAQEMWM